MMEAPAEAKAIRAAVGSLGLNADFFFDQLYPPSVRRLSRSRWTPVDVARRAAALLAGDHAGGVFLDVGSGVGKFCLVAALSTNARYVGVERSAPFTDVAHRTSRTLDLEARCNFIHGDAFALDWSAFDGVYLYNPFSEALYEPAEHGPSWRARADAIAATQQHLLQLPLGARVVTYCGFGGAFPAAFDRAASERSGGGELEVWVRAR